MRGGSVGYKNGHFEITINRADFSKYSGDTLPEAHPVLEIRGDVSATNPNSYAALMCGNAAGDFLYGGVSPEHQWTVGQLIGGTIHFSRHRPGAGKLPASIRNGCSICALTAVSREAPMIEFSFRLGA